MRFLVFPLVLVASCSGRTVDSNNTSSGVSTSSSSSSSSGSSSGSLRPDVVSAPFAPDGGACPDGWFIWDDQGFVQPDHLCHKKCEADVECGGGYPHCRTLGLTLGGDYNCNGKVRICDVKAEDDCP